MKELIFNFNGEHPSTTLIDMLNRLRTGITAGT
jgi:hypothetical protein